MTEPLPRIALTRRTGSEPFHHAGRSFDFALLEFWRWASSDLASNVVRGALAEFLVARALGIETITRGSWDACDLCTPEGRLVEVKSSAYLQSWHQKKHSVPSFSIRPSRHWSADTNEFAAEAHRHADVYVFAMLAHRDSQSLDPLDVQQWEFHVLATQVLSARCSTQKSIGLPSLKRLGAAPATFESLRQVVNAAANTR